MVMEEATWDTLDTLDKSKVVFEGMVALEEGGEGVSLPEPKFLEDIKQQRIL